MSGAIASGGKKLSSEFAGLNVWAPGELRVAQQRKVDKDSLAQMWSILEGRSSGNGFSAGLNGLEKKGFRAWHTRAAQLQRAYQIGNRFGTRLTGVYCRVRLRL